MTKKKEQNLKKSDFLQINFTEKQIEFQKTIRSSTITFCQGPAGSAKTFLSTYMALKLLAEKQVDKIILCKPYQESGESIGFLKGTLEEKVKPYFESYWDNINKIITKQAAEFLVATGDIEIQPLAYLRGRSFSNSCILLDEAQNAGIEQLILFITRMGEGCKLIICGDVSQHDISSDKLAFPTLINLLNGLSHEEHKVSTFYFTYSDVMRHPLLSKITEVYEKWKYNEGRKSGLFKK